MTFSDPDLRKLLGEFFVCTWRNLEGDPKAGGSPRIPLGDGVIALPRGTGHANFQILILTPDARLLHALIGSIEAGDLRWELAQALITYEAIKARPDSASRVVVWRQDRIQRQFLGKRRPSAGASFRIKPTTKKPKSASAKVSRPTRRHTEREREIVKRHPLAPEHKIKTKWLAIGRARGGFPKDGLVISVPERLTQGAAGVVSRTPHRPLPWEDMPKDLHARLAKTLGVTPTKPPVKISRTRRSD